MQKYKSWHLCCRDGYVLQMFSVTREGAGRVNKELICRQHQATAEQPLWLQPTTEQAASNSRVVSLAVAYNRASYSRVAISLQQSFLSVAYNRVSSKLQQSSLFGSSSYSRVGTSLEQSGWKQDIEEQTASYSKVAYGSLFGSSIQQSKHKATAE